MTKIYQNGLEAFRGLNECGLELPERDREVAELLWRAINHKAASLEDALLNSTPEQFVRAFLHVSAPYVLMLKDLLGMFEAAGVKKGEKQWRIEFDDFIEEVEHFKEWERITRNIGTSVECPNPSFRQFWGIWRVLQCNNARDAEFWNSCKLHQAKFSLPLATKLHPGWMHDLWAIVIRAQKVLEDAGLDLSTARGPEVFRKTEEDFFSVPNLCQQQHDFGISQAAYAYEVLHNDPDLCHQISLEVQKHLAGARREWVWLDASVDQLRSFLNLPIWQRRHDFYAAWVAALMLEEFREDGIWIPAVDGVISFPFRETHVGLMIDRTADVISERRFRINSPVGTGRKNAVQPDYGWWRPPVDGEVPKAEDCVLVVEVKHYKKAARSSWRDVLLDYANAHPHAHVLLVNYGPGSNSVDDLPENLARRCLVIADLRPGAQVDGEDVVCCFRRLVRKHVTPKRGAIAIDVSTSMTIRGRSLAKLMVELASEFDCDTLLALDKEIAGEIPIAGLTDETIHRFALNNGEDFEHTLSNALERYDQISLVTDWGGYAFAEKSKHFRIEFRSLNDELYLLVVHSRGDPGLSKLPDDHSSARC